VSVEEKRIDGSVTDSLSALILRRREAPSRRMGAASCFETPHSVRLLSIRLRKARP